MNYSRRATKMMQLIFQQVHHSCTFTNKYYYEMPKLVVKWSRKFTMYVLSKAILGASKYTSGSLMSSFPKDQTCDPIQ
eukprot:c18979_g2_i1 orf=149-382(+)